MGSPNGLTLTALLDQWVLTLRSGSTIQVWAHGVKERDNQYVFVALMQGEPNYELELCRIPVDIVVDFVGG